MRRIFITICTFVLCIFTTMAQMSYTFNFNEDDYTLVRSEDTLSIISKSDNYVYKSDTTLAALPYSAYNILLPRGGSVANYEVSGERKLIAENVFFNVNSCDGLGLTQSRQTSSAFSKIAKKSSLNPVELGMTHILKGYSFASFLISPYLYDAEEKCLYFMENITVKVHHNISTENLSRVCPYEETGLEDLVINADEWRLWYNAANIRTTTFDPNEQIDYVIVSPDNLADAFEPLVKWKNMKGVRTKVVTLGEIYDQYSNERYPKIRIKKYLRDCYENKGLKFAMLVGDNSNFPSSECDVFYMAKQRYNCPVDLFYACFDRDFDWSQNNDTVTVGYYGDSLDFCPEIDVSRLPVRTATQINNYIKKLLKYEQSPQRQAYLKTLFLASSFVNRGGSIDKGQQQSDTLLNKYIIPTGWDGDITYLYESKSNLNGGASYDLTPENLHNELNKGYHIVNVFTHGLPQKWSDLEDRRDYNHTLAQQLNNKNSSIILSAACLTNAFDSTQEPSLSEAMLRNPNGGAIAFLGSIREGSSDFEPDILDIGVSMRYNAEFFKYLLSNNYLYAKSYASVAARSRSSMLKYCDFSENKQYNWVQLLLNPVGEPEFQIWTENPSDFSDISIEKIGNTLKVSTGGITGCKVVVSNFDLPVPYFQVNVTDSICEFTNIPDTVNVVVAKRNYAPAVYKISDDTLHLINNVITSNRSFRWNNIVLGSDDPETSQCECIITNGANVTFEYESTINFKSGFKCNLGSSFEILKVE